MGSTAVESQLRLCDIEFNYETICNDDTEVKLEEKYDNSIEDIKGKIEIKCDDVINAGVSDTNIKNEEIELKDEITYENVTEADNPDISIKYEEIEIKSQERGTESAEPALSGRRLVVRLTRLQYSGEDHDGDDESNLESMSFLSIDDSDKDSNYEPSELDKNEVAESIVSLSTDSEQQSIAIPQQNPSTFHIKDAQTNGCAKVENWLNKDSNEATDPSLAHDQESQNVPTVIVNRYKKKMTFCVLCKFDVLNFHRHLERHHKDCKKVAKMLTFPKNSKERKRIISILRNEGHFGEFIKGNVRPVCQRKSKLNTEHIPCVNCKGVYSQKYLYRHKKNCLAADVNKYSQRSRHMSASQTLVACTLNKALYSSRVKKEVFNRMKADRISMLAKTDPLICQYGDQYLKEHECKQMSALCSNRMRQLARLLIEFRRLKNNENYKLVDAIDPDMFDAVIEGVKRLAGFDPDKKKYRAPSLPSNIGTVLKQVSDLLLSLILKKDPAFVFSEPEIKMTKVKLFKDLILSQWTTETSILPLNDLNKTSNKPKILSLTKDIVKFKDYVADIANKAATILRKNPDDKQEFKKLVDATLTLTILYNRRCIGDVQHTKLQTYLDSFSTLDQDKCLDFLSTSEKVLTKHYKRVVTEGGDSKPIVILFPQNIQDFLKVIIDVRQSTDLVPQNNPFLFVKPKTEHQAMGYAAFRKYAEKANLDYASEILSNRLRRQIATVMQILNLNQEEVEEFVHFMDQTENSDNEFYKLPQDVYQVAKISKLLILMDKGFGHEYKGKSLNEIDINPEVEEAESEDSEIEEPIEVDPTASASNFMPSTSGNEKQSDLTSTSSVGEEHTITAEDTAPSVMSNGIVSLLGDDPSTPNNLGPNINEELVLKWSTYLREGVNSEVRKELIQKYSVPANCKTLNAPLMNEEVKSIIPLQSQENDRFLSSIQGQLGASLSALGAIISQRIDEPEKEMLLCTEVTEKLVDAAQLIASVHHSISLKRKFEVNPFINDDIKVALNSNPADEYLFGSNFLSKVVTCQDMNEACAEILKKFKKDDTTDKRGEHNTGGNAWNGVGLTAGTLAELMSSGAYKQTGRSAWTSEQAKVVIDHFKDHIQLKKSPRKYECLELIRKHPDLLGNKDWVRIKTYVYNWYRNM